MKISFTDFLKEDASAGSTSTGAVAVGADHGFSRGDQEGGTEYSKKKKKKKIKTYFEAENSSFDFEDANAKLKGAEKYADSYSGSVGFALETENGDLIKVYVDADQCEEFSQALSAELAKNKEDGYSHRELGEIIYELSDKFKIVNIVWPNLEGDEEEEEDTVEAEGDEDLDLDAEGDEDLDAEIEPEVKTDSTEAGAQSALSSVIDMMKADAEARQADAEARKAEAKTKEAGYSKLSAEEKLKQEEKILDMETYNKNKKEEEQEAKRLTDLAKYQHDMEQDEVDLDSGTADPLELDSDDGFSFESKDLSPFTKYLINELTIDVDDPNDPNALTSIRKTLQKAKSNPSRAQVDRVASTNIAAKDAAAADNSPTKTLDVKITKMKQQIAQLEKRRGDIKKREANSSQPTESVENSPTCEIVYIDEAGDIVHEGILSETATRIFKRQGTIITRAFRCTSGPKIGQIVTNPSSCAQRKDPKKVKQGRRSAALKKSVRISKTKMSKKKAVSKMVTKMNARLAK